MPYIKTDIKDFFANISLDILINLVDSNINLVQTELTQYQLSIIKELLRHCGNGQYPLIENSTTSSFLATEIYLEAVDNSLYEFLKKYVNDISNVSLVRYVDDLYICFSSSKNKQDLMTTYNTIINKYSSDLKEVGLSLNISKCGLKNSVEISEDLKSSLYDEFVNGKRFEIAGFCPSGMSLFLNKLLDAIYFDVMNTQKYNEIIDSLFTIEGIEFTPNEVFNYFLYENNGQLKTEDIRNTILKMIESDITFISIDPKRLTTLVMKTESSKAIKALLNQLFQKHKENIWNSYDTSIAIHYLIQSHFKHIDLLNILKHRCPNLYKYYIIFCKGNRWAQSKAESTNTLIFAIDGDIITFYLYGMYKFKKTSGNLLEAYAYYKNYFDRVTAHLAYTSKYDNNGKKPNYNRFFKEVELINFFKHLNAQNADIIIKNAHILRNSNPVSHASAELIISETSSSDINKSISELHELIKHACEYIESNEAPNY